MVGEAKSINGTPPNNLVSPGSSTKCCDTHLARQPINDHTLSIHILWKTQTKIQSCDNKVYHCKNCFKQLVTPPETLSCTMHVITTSRVIDSKTGIGVYVKCDRPNNSMGGKKSIFTFSPSKAETRNFVKKCRPLVYNTTPISLIPRSSLPL